MFAASIRGVQPDSGEVAAARRPEAVAYSRADGMLGGKFAVTGSSEHRVSLPVLAKAA